LLGVRQVNTLCLARTRFGVVASLEFDNCAGFQAFAQDADAGERSYAAFLSGRLQNLNPSLLSAQYRTLAHRAGQRKEFTQRHRSSTIAPSDGWPAAATGPTLSRPTLWSPRRLLRRKDGCDHCWPGLGRKPDARKKTAIVVLQRAFSVASNWC